MKRLVVRLAEFRDLVLRRVAAETALLKIRAALSRYDQGGTHSTYLPAGVRLALKKYDRRVAVTPEEARRTLGTQETCGISDCGVCKKVDEFVVDGKSVTVHYTAAPFNVYLSHELLRDYCWPLAPETLRKERSLEQQVIDASRRKYLSEAWDEGCTRKETFEQWLLRQEGITRVRALFAKFDLLPWQKEAIRNFTDFRYRSDTPRRFVIRNGEKVYLDVTPLWDVSVGGDVWRAAVWLDEGPESACAPDIWRTAILPDGHETCVKFWRPRTVLFSEFLHLRARRRRFATAGIVARDSSA